MNDAGALAADERFFSALLHADGATLEELLTDDFLMIEVMGGSEIAKRTLVDAVSSKQLVFEAIDKEESRVRMYGCAAVVTGSTRMRGRVGETRFAAQSAYTHVFVEQAGRWLLASAQGTPIRTESA